MNTGCTCRVFEDRLHPRRPSLLSSTEEDMKPNFYSMQLGMLRIRSGIFLSGRCVIFFLKKSRRVWRLWSFRGTTCPSRARSLPNIRRIGTPAANPAFQAESTTYLRVFVASQSESAVLAVAKAMKDISLKHFSGTWPNVFSFVQSHVYKPVI